MEKVEPGVPCHGAAATDLASGQGDLLRQALRTMAASGDVETRLRQHPPGGHRHDRAVLATYLLERGIDTVPDNVLLTSGSQQALDMVLRTLALPGDVLAVDALSYPGIKLLASAHSLKLAPVPVTATGPDLDTLDQMCRARPVRAIYTIPTVHNPLGWVLDREQRERLANLARLHDCLLIEDGTYAFLESSPPPPLQAFAPERTCYVAGLSKNVAPGLRFGFAVVPDRHLEAATSGLRAAAWGAPGVITAIATSWISDGTVTRLEKDRREDAAARQDIARAALAGLDITAHPVSYTLWLALEPHQRTDHVAADLAEQGILVSTADAFATGPTRPRALRLALATPPRDELGAALRRVKDTLDAIPP
ncbi:PLP-dependent aminotransferase family protein [Streptomyces sp. NPDC047990]|uniref:aminotransferase-like domain-containing protein n=1 Tax=Streptomyces sp. NPDC047990 TaxID=3365496 RepID=UPI00371ACE6E